MVITLSKLPKFRAIFGEEVEFSVDEMLAKQYLKQKTIEHKKVLSAGFERFKRFKTMIRSPTSAPKIQTVKIASESRNSHDSEEFESVEAASNAFFPDARAASLSRSPSMLEC